MVESIPRAIDIPDNIVNFLKRHDGVNLSFNINPASADEGYAHVIWYSAVLSALTRTCCRCGHDPLWNPDDSESKCKRHTYGAWRYDPVFVWTPNKCPFTVEEAFDEWLRRQPSEKEAPYKAAKRIIFGSINW